MQHQGGLVEFTNRKPLQHLLVIGLVVFAISFVATWYRVWWDSIIAFFITLLGYYAIRDVNVVPMGWAFDIGYYGTIFSFILHGIAFGIIAAELSTKRIIAIVSSHTEKSTGILVFALIVELVMLCVTGGIMGLYYRFRAEIKEAEINSVRDENYRELL